MAFPNAASKPNPTPAQRVFLLMFKWVPGASAMATPPRMETTHTICDLVSVVCNQIHSVEAANSVEEHWMVSDDNRAPMRGKAWNRKTSAPTPMMPLNKKSGKESPD